MITGCRVSFCVITGCGISFSVITGCRFFLTENEVDTKKLSLKLWCSVRVGLL